MKALLFPGQGSQVVGMGHEFYNKFEIVKKLNSGVNIDELEILDNQRVMTTNESNKDVIFKTF